jgi:sulfide:quinone oxidoreductase
MTARILVLGGGVGGSIVANRLVRKLRASEAQITVIDPADQHVYQPGLLYLPFNKKNPQGITRPIRRLLDKRIELIEGTVDSIDVPAQSVSVGSDSRP